MTNRYPFIVALLVIFLNVACRNKKDVKEDTPTSGTTVIAVDETFAPIISNEINVFESIYLSSGIIEKACPETDAFNLLLKDSVNMIIATRRLIDQEINFFRGKQIFPKEIMIARDGVALIVNNKNKDTLLTTSVIRQIMTGEVTNWNQINPLSELGTIKTVFDNPNSSTANFVVQQVCNNKPLSPTLSALKSNREVIRFVSQTPNALGIIGASWISNHKDTTCMGFLNKIKVVAISKAQKATAGNSYQPYQGYIATGDYPYCRDIYAIMTDPHLGLCSGFISFIASDRGQRIILKSGVLPANLPVRSVHITN